IWRPLADISPPASRKSWYAGHVTVWSERCATAWEDGDCARRTATGPAGRDTAVGQADGDRPLHRVTVGGTGLTARREHSCGGVHVTRFAQAPPSTTARHPGSGHAGRRPCATPDVAARRLPAGGTLRRIQRRGPRHELRTTTHPTGRRGGHDS